MSPICTDMRVGIHACVVLHASKQACMHACMHVDQGFTISTIHEIAGQIDRLFTVRFLPHTTTSPRTAIHCRRRRISTATRLLLVLVFAGASHPPRRPRRRRCASLAHRGRGGFLALARGPLEVNPVELLTPARGQGTVLVELPLVLCPVVELGVARGLRRSRQGFEVEAMLLTERAQILVFPVPASLRLDPARSWHLSRLRIAAALLAVGTTHADGTLGLNPWTFRITSFKRARGVLSTVAQE